ncbi:MAG: DNA helicase RecQ [Methanosarcinaceae archaeon]
MYQTLKKYFGYTEFRPLQQEIIETVLAKKDASVIMPTGGGKSLCYQLPALLVDGLTIVVSPLISLMKDQVDALKSNGISAACWNSTLTTTEIQQVRADLDNNKIRLLYVAPERLMMPHFFEYVKQLKVNLFAIDEAHCISEWGHDFRPEYRKLQILKQQFTEIPIITLTATATPRVRGDIIKQLKLENAKVFIASFDRHNLYYEVRPKRDTYVQIVDYLHAHAKDSGIIYCMSRKRVEEVAESLRYDGFRALPYHAGLEKNERMQNQEKFIRDDVEIIVATIAFGMGIDKPNVRFVIHVDLPKNLEGYYQETGRAGRDGLRSECILFYSYGDRKKIEFFFKEIQDPQELRISYEKLQQMVKYGESYICRRKQLLNYFGEDYKPENCENCDNCLKEEDLFDATVVAQKLFSCVARVHERFGMNYVIDVLRGSNSERIIHNRHNLLSTFNIGKEYPKKQWQAFTRELVQKNYLVLEGDQYPVLRLTEKSRAVLFKKEPVKLTNPETAAKISTRRVAEDLDVNRELFEILRELRKQVADEEKLPPYIIFHDKTLEKMAGQFPQTWAELSVIHGMGEKKLNRYGPRFLKAIVGFCQQNNIQAKPPQQTRQERREHPQVKGKTEQITYHLLQKGLPAPEIAKQRQLAVSTIYGHLEKLIQQGEGIDLADYVPVERQKQILAVFERLQTRALTPVKEELGDEFSYDEIRLTRGLLPAQNAEE